MPDTTTTATRPHLEHVDVLIVGAGISGIGCACHLQQQHPGKTYAILEARSATAGTWDLFRYPGIRSDSDLHTFAYGFKPWEHDKAIADGSLIRDYLRQTASENGIDRHIRTGHKVLEAAWSSEQARWIVDIERSDGESLQLSSNWLFSASGYYNYDEAYTPDFAGAADFEGPIVHPQFWPDDLDYAGRRVVIIGSGATAVTMLPAMAADAAHVTMLQRSPSYVVPIPSEDVIANTLRKLLSSERAYAITRRKNIWLQRAIFRFCKRFPRRARALIRWINAKRLPADFPVDTHFNPAYEPWDQRVCMAPDGDFFKALSNGSASIVTDRIETFTRTGLRLTSGRELKADLVVTATGLNIQMLGGMRFTVDGQPVDVRDTVVFKGMMLTELPNFAFAMGYTNASWTLKVDLVCEHLCRLLTYMDAHGHNTCRAELTDPTMATRPMLDFAAGYVQRAKDQYPRQGDTAPWQQAMDYTTDIKQLREAPVAESGLHFSTRIPQTSRLATELELAA